MKLGSLNGVRGNQLKIIVIALSTILLVWGWEKASNQSAFILPPDTLALFPPVARSRYEHHHPSAEEDFPNADTFVRPLTEGADKVLTESPLGSSIISSSHTAKKDTETILQEREGCNYGKGKWIADDRRPLYSGFGCKRWLSEMWACRLTQRVDFSYEKFKWQPEGCKMPEFEGSEFLRRMQDKTIAYVGDSLGRQMFQSIMCMVGKESPDAEDVGGDYGFVQELGAKRPNGWAYRFPRTNTTILFYWSSTLCELEPLNVADPATSYAMHLDRPPAFLEQNLHKFDVLVLNSGHHWNRGKLNANRWEMYVRGAPNTNRKIARIWNAKKFAIHSTVKWLNSQLPHHPRLKIFFRSISPRHFINGDWNTGGRCDSMSSLAGGNTVSQDHSDDADAEGAVNGTGIKLLDITALSQLRDEGHISRYSIKAAEGVQDCLHWCLPGIPDTWNEILAAQL
ncbi:protein trichome birefringence-like 16 [Typha angustifolia]|uniref:protein trichome birefringence-like 16 n=1 Tax=Typha angustifolia TaxID=59011 RepID=UPI003C2B9B95